MKLSCLIPDVLRRDAGEGPAIVHRLKPGTGGRLVVNADDWGRDQENTNHILECVLRRAVSSVSAMVFMTDAERAADLALEYQIDAGLHLNLTTAFSATSSHPRLVHHAEKVVRYLRLHRLAPVCFHPGLHRSFEYLMRIQWEEFERLYGRPPDRIDGHHHMHLCANVVWAGLLPAGIATRRHFSFERGEKSLPNRAYRAGVNRWLARRYRIADHLFSLTPLDHRDRLIAIVRLARKQHIEVETHPIHPSEHRFLCSGSMAALAGDIPIAARYWPSREPLFPQDTGPRDNHPARHESDTEVS